MPRVYVIDEAAPNAFATGRNPEHAAVAATTGIMQVLTASELRAVMAHELTHVDHRDILISTISATMAGAISMLANFAMLFGGRDSEGRPANPIAGLAVALLAPLAASLIQLAISRAREFEADRGGAELSGDPRSLASALQKIHAYAQGTPLIAAERNPQTAHMMIDEPAPRRRHHDAVLDPSVDRGAGRAAAGDGRRAAPAAPPMRARAGGSVPKPAVAARGVDLGCRESERLLLDDLPEGVLRAILSPRKV